jgi:glycosyltransferase involved in cell wall biosynthesis
MSGQVAISVVIPCYNSEGFVERAVRSALEQTYPIEEVICVDDGSTDGTLEVLRGIERSEGGITIHSQKNQGICGARNTGLEIASGEYIAFLDHDDILHPRKLEHQARLIVEASSQPDLLAAPYVEVFPDEEREPTVRNVYSQDPWVGLIHARLGRTSSNLWRAETVREVGTWKDEDGLSLDTGLMFRMLKKGCKIINDTEPLTTRYTLDVSASRVNRRKGWVTFLRLRVKMFDYLESNGMMTERRKTALQMDMVEAIRGIYRYSPEMAMEKDREVLRPRFDSLKARVGPGRLYQVLYRVLGLRYAELLYPAWLRIRGAVSKWL